MGKRGEKRKKERERGNEKDRWERRWKINLDKNKLGAPFWGDGAKPREAQPAIVGVVIGLVCGRSVAAVVGTLRTVRVYVTIQPGLDIHTRK